tara:strand:+ start:421 stop:999 length:579 start_codon:yes stop_codon:yes gene_type:complete
MPIGINGNGTITGVTVGGLPDGIVDTDMLANGAVTATKRGAGAILQVVHVSFSTETAIASTTFTNTGLTASITPSSSSNKILVIVSQNLQFARSNTSASGGMKVIKLVSGGSDQDIYEASHSPSALGIQVNAHGSGIIARMNACVNILDSPSTTSSVAYRVQAAAGTTSDNGSVVAQEEDTPSHITLMEVAV